MNECWLDGKSKCKELESVTEETKNEPKFDDTTIIKSTYSPSTSSDSNSSQEDNKCIICFESSINTLFLPCRHVAVCKECADNLEVPGSIKGARCCPICKCKVGEVVELG